MKRVIYLLFAAVLLASCNSKPKEMAVTVENPSDFDRTTDLVELSLDGVKAKVTLAEGQAYVVKNAKGEIIPSQVTYDGKLVFQSGVKAKETVTFTVSAGEKQEFKAQTYGRFITERKDDFAWENDRVAFRIYGPALIASDGPSNGLDIWYKRTNDMIIDKWYKDELSGTASYHEDRGEGLDDYKVGRSLGAGAMAPFVNGKLWLNENFASQELLENGPLRTTLKLTYKDLDVDGKAYSETRTFSIDAGSQFSKVVQEYGVAEDMTVAAGIVKRPANDTIIVSPEKDYIIYREPSEKAGPVYLGLVFPAGIDSMVVDTYKVANAKTKKDDAYSHVLAVATYKANQPIVYYTGYGWSKFGFADEAAFQTYTSNFSKGLKQPLVVKF
ncbi:uncharacterized protein DUF4861 [Dysgonomonas alginatilytica]|uniref:Uncharacterized protein DUF4861 n=1 Tax=Dysgonomonas alginatilytica TaxID=1605892 RepID=A0A2V3PS46_9BACT|nr:DUF4861 domain-containing protein [Dysgonomonas alginatilytica]PXV65464.1 uncharacterized protein DUF4861 [Dysgonomonas alginatilytica]